MRNHSTPRAARALALRASLFVLVACARGFQVANFHTSPDLFVASLAEYQKKKWDNAIRGFERLTLDLAARDTLLPLAYWYLALAREGKGEHLLAATSFLRMADMFPDDSLADDALLASGDSYAKLWRRSDLDPQYGDLAQFQYRTLLTVYPDSPLRERAEKASQRLDEMRATKEYETGRHYARRKAFDSALIYFKFVVKEYPNTSVVKHALIRMVEVYRNPLMNYQEEARETCTTLRAAYPGDPDVARLCLPVAVPADSADKPLEPATPAN